MFLLEPPPPHYALQGAQYCKNKTYFVPQQLLDPVYCCGKQILLIHLSQLKVIQYFIRNGIKCQNPNAWAATDSCSLSLQAVI